MSDPLDNHRINAYLDMPMSSEPDRQVVNGSESEADLGNNSSDVVDDTDEDPDFLPSDSAPESSDDEDILPMLASMTESTDTNGVEEESSEADQWTIYEGRQKQFPFNLLSTYAMPNSQNPEDYYKVFLNSDILQMMVDETNKHAAKVISELRLNRSSRLRKWRPTNAEEFTKFIGILMWMGLTSNPRITDYWSNNILYKNYVTSKVMSRNRFQLLLRFWHFNDNDNIARDGRIAKILPLITKLNNLFGSCKVAGRELVADESMIPFRGRLLFRQYLPNKAHKYGIKVFKLCDKHGYTFKVKLYMGRGTSTNENELMATSIVMELMKNHLYKGHVLYVDNYYTSLELANTLLSKSTHLVGTLRASRKGLPVEVMKLQPLQKGEMISLENPNGLVVSRWKDKRDVRMLSTIHGIDFVETGRKDKQQRAILKPEVINDYNKAKMGIDVSDQMSAYNSGVRKSMRWYHKVAEELILGTALVNSWLAYTENIKARPTASGRQKNTAFL